MQIRGLEFGVLFFAAFALTAVLTPFMKSLAHRFGIIDHPNQSHKSHTNPIPYLGGLSIVVSTVFVTWFSFFFKDFSNELSQLAISILFPASLMALIGLIDDVKQLKPWPRFIYQNIIGLVSAIVLVRTNTLGMPTGQIFVDLSLTIIWLVGITNAINFFDNIDGGAAGSIAITSIALCVVALSNGQTLIAGMSLVLSGSSFGFLMWNKMPATIYMGDAGALFLGLLIASLTVRLDSRESLSIFGFLIPIFLLAIPILDTSVVVVKRLAKGISPFTGGKDHLAHRLHRLGFEKSVVVVILWIMTSVFCAVAVLIQFSEGGLVFFWSILSCLLWVILFLFFIRTPDFDEPK